MSALAVTEACREAFRILALAAERAEAPLGGSERQLRGLVLDLVALKIALDRRLLPGEVARPGRALLAGDVLSWSDMTGLFLDFASRRGGLIGEPESGRESIWPLNEYVPASALAQAVLSIRLLPGAIPVRALGDGYQALLEEPHPAERRARARKELRQKRRVRGLFFTPERIVQRMAALALPRPVKGSRAPFVCDPAVGTGHFLVSVAWRLARGNPRAARHVAETRLYGMDNDPEAVRLARTSLWLEFSSPLVPFDLPPHFCCGDALVGSAWETRPVEEALRLRLSLAGTDWLRAFPEIAARGGFDLVIANPPYDVLTGFSRHPELAPYVRYLRQSGLYENALGGQLNLYRLFIERSLALVRPGGRITFVVPAGFLMDRSAAPLRKSLLRHHGLRSIEHFSESEKGFDGVGQSITIFLAERGKGRPKRIRVRGARGASGAHDDSRPVTRVEQYVATHLLEKLDPCLLPIPLAAPWDWKLVHWLARHARARFGDLAEGGVGEVDQTVYGRHLRDEGGVLLVRGAHLSPFCADLDPSPARQRFVEEVGLLEQKGRASGFCRAHAREERVAQLGIRNLESRPRLVASCVPSGVYLGNSVNGWRPKPSVPMTLLVALLNSALYDWRFRLTSSNNNINLYEVEGLPLPDALVQHFAQDPNLPCRERNRFASLLAALERAVHALERAAAKETDILPLRKLMDLKIFELFSLPERFRKHLIQGATSPQ
ncbi:MAG: N-6 DNA methylase [Planctomycetota bacterium]